MTALGSRVAVRRTYAPGPECVREPPTRGAGVAPESEVGILGAMWPRAETGLCGAGLVPSV